MQTAQGFRSDVRVAKGSAEGNAKSFKAVLSLAINRNDEVKVRAEGPDAEAALSALTRLVEGNFGEK